MQRSYTYSAWGQRLSMLQHGLCGSAEGAVVADAVKPVRAKADTDAEAKRFVDHAVLVFR